MSSGYCKTKGEPLSEATSAHRTRTPPPLTEPKEQAVATSAKPKSKARTPPATGRALAHANISATHSSKPRASSAPRSRPSRPQSAGERDSSTLDVNGEVAVDVEIALSTAAKGKSGMAELESRTDMCDRLEKVPFMNHADTLFMHGRGYQGPVKDPVATWESSDKPRDDHDCPHWLTATEFMDSRHVMRAKVACLANLLRISRKTVLYTGAGISASVVGQAARSGQNTVGFEASPLSAKPTPTHFALASLGLQNLVHGWVQQNHDGLPQKAGFPQHRINEIHGSWFDPCNPVVKYSGSLHDRAHPWMQLDAETSDLVLVLGTSLGGLNADQVATNAAERSLSKASLGTVCINLQQTPHDDKMTLRIFGRSDEVLQMVHSELGLGAVPVRPPRWPSKSHALVPYDADGRRVADTEEQWMWLDLRDRAKVRITPGHNIQGACQPKFMHIGASRAVKYGNTTRKPAEGLGTVLRREEHSFVLNIEGEGFHVGVWWLVDAINGTADVLPVVNQKPVFAPKGTA